MQKLFGLLTENCLTMTKIDASMFIQGIFYRIFNVKQSFGIRKFFFAPLLTLVLFLFAITASSQPISSLETLTIELVKINQLSLAKQKISSDDRNRWLKNAESRRNILIKALQTNPASIEKFLIPKKIYTTLPTIIKP